MNIILASASERRKELLKRIVPDFKIMVSDFDEEAVEFSGDPRQYVETLALGKAMKVKDNLKGNSLIIGCDTIVYSKGKVLGKPKDKDEAFQMLKNLSDNVHQVYSGLAVIRTDSIITKVESVCTEVYFSKLTDAEILSYVNSEEPYDKAGAYGIQGKAGVFVYKIDGCYYNVVGLPLNCLYYMLKEMGVNL